jgi:hypothetical protein
MAQCPALSAVSHFRPFRVTQRCARSPPPRVGCRDNYTRIQTGQRERERERERVECPLCVYVSTSRVFTRGHGSCGASPCYNAGCMGRRMCCSSASRRGARVSISSPPTTSSSPTSGGIVLSRPRCLHPPLREPPPPPPCPPPFVRNPVLLDPVLLRFCARMRLSVSYSWHE